MKLAFKLNCFCKIFFLEINKVIIGSETQIQLSMLSENLNFNYLIYRFKGYNTIIDLM